MAYVTLDGSVQVQVEEKTAMTRSDEYGPRFFTTAAKGKLCGEDTYAVLIRFPRDMHEELQARAQRANSSYAEQVRLAVEWGLESGDQK